MAFRKEIRTVAVTIGRPALSELITSIKSNLVFYIAMRTGRVTCLL